MLLSLVFSYTITSYLLKKNANLPSRTRRLAWQFFFCAVGASLFALATESDLPFTNLHLLVVGVIRAVNAFGAYCQWRATVLQPIYQVGEMVMPTIVGFLIFHEAKSLSRAEKIFFAVGIVGGLIIAFSF